MGKKKVSMASKIFYAIPKVMVWLGALSVLVMAVLICYNVAMRYFFGAPKGWTIEVSQFLMLAVFFLPLAYVQLERKHIKVELFVSHLPQKVRNILREVVIPLLALAVNSALLWQVGRLAWKLLKRGTASDDVGIPLFPISMILVVSFAVAIAVFLMQFRKGSGEQKEKSESPI
ncbi:MAG: TRAP transporter small permease [Deltaproteobacteria bacterium]|nr:TRAP transporter small permease [Deltaproteobacteria bacterium]